MAFASHYGLAINQAGLGYVHAIARNWEAGTVWHNGLAMPLYCCMYRFFTAGYRQTGWPVGAWLAILFRKKLRPQ